MPLFTTTVGYSSSTLQSNRTIYVSKSLSGVMTQRAVTGQVFSFTLTFREMTKIEALQIITFFEANAGSTITLMHPQHLLPILSPSNGGVINGSNQTGSSIGTDGWASNIQLFAPGDIISIGANGTKVYRVTSPVNSDVSGNATINIFPDLVGSPANNATINHTGVLFNCVAKTVSKYKTNEDNVYTYKIDLDETL